MTLHTNRNKGETDAAYYLRRWRISTDRAANAHRQAVRCIAERNRGGAIFYQFEQARWHLNAQICRADYDRAIERYIPGTALLWEEIFPSPDWSQVYDMVGVRSEGEANRIDAAAKLYDTIRSTPRASTENRLARASINTTYGKFADYQMSTRYQEFCAQYGTAIERFEKRLTGDSAVIGIDHAQPGADQTVVFLPDRIKGNRSTFVVIDDPEPFCVKHSIAMGLLNECPICGKGPCTANR